MSDAPNSCFDVSIETPILSRSDESSTGRQLEAVCENTRDLNIDKMKVAKEEASFTFKEWKAT